MARKTKILIIGSSPILPTGLGETTRLIFGGLLDHYANKYELHQIGLFNSIAVASPRWPVYPTRGKRELDGHMRFRTDDLFGQITFKEVVRSVKPDIVIAFNDPQRVFHVCSPPEKRDYKLIVYVTIDGSPYPLGGPEKLDQADLILTMSEFSTNALRERLPARPSGKFGFMYAPADTERFKPVSDTEKTELRSKLLPPWMPQSAFILGWVGRNQWRKQVWLLYRVIRAIRTGSYIICKKCERVTPTHPGPAAPHFSAHYRNGLANSCKHCRSTDIKKADPLEDIFLWLHMPDEPQQAWSKSYLEEQFDARPGRDLHYTDGHKVENHRAIDDMPSLYQAWDCMLYLSGGEGFGVPPWEAMCCGLPVVYTNYSSHAEFLDRAGAGLHVGGTLQPEPQTCIRRLVANSCEAIQAVRRLYFNRQEGQSLGANGRRYVQGFTSIMESKRWHEILQRVLNPSPYRSEVDMAECTTISPLN